jgi:hypothetical protein
MNVNGRGDLRRTCRCTILEAKPRQPHHLLQSQRRRVACVFDWASRISGGGLSIHACSTQKMTTRHNNTMQPMRASRLAQVQVGSSWRLARTADGDRWAAMPVV